jgi:hypothetical protein
MRRVADEIAPVISLPFGVPFGDASANEKAMHQHEMTNICKITLLLADASSMHG